MSQKQRYVVDRGEGKWLIVDLQEAKCVVTGEWTKLEVDRWCERLQNGVLVSGWNDCRHYKLDIDELRRKHGWESETVSEKTFKVGDRVRVNNRNLICDGRCGEVKSVVGDCYMVTLDGEGISVRNLFRGSLEHETATKPRHIPQVGEVWRSRSGEFTVKLEPNDEPAALADGYVFGGYCSDKTYRTFTAEGAYWNDGSDVKADLAELVSEAEQPAEISSPEPQVEAPPQLEVSVDVVPIVSVKDQSTGVLVLHDSEREVLIECDRLSPFVSLGAAPLDEIAALARCFTKLHEVLSREVAK